MIFWKWFSEVMGFHASTVQDSANVLKQLSFYVAEFPVGRKCWYRNKGMEIEEVFHLLLFPKWRIHAPCLHSIRLCGNKVPGCLRRTLSEGKRVRGPVKFMTATWRWHLFITESRAVMLTWEEVKLILYSGGSEKFTWQSFGDLSSYFSVQFWLQIDKWSGHGLRRICCIQISQIILRWISESRHSIIHLG